MFHYPRIYLTFIKNCFTLDFREPLFYADYTKGNVRMKYLTDVLVSLSMLNHLSDSLLDIIKNDKHLVKSLEMLGYIKSMVLAWRKSVDEKV